MDNATKEKLRKMDIKYSNRKRNINEIYNYLIEETRAALSDFKDDEYEIIKARLDKVEKDLIKSASFSFSSFALELVLTVALGPVFKYIAFNPIIQFSTKKVIDNNKRMARLLISIEKGAEKRLGENVNTFIPWKEDVILLLEGLTKTEMEILSEAHKQVVDSMKILGKDSLTEAMKKIGGSLPKMGIGTDNSVDKSKILPISTKYLANTIALSVIRKLTMFKNNNDHVCELTFIKLKYIDDDVKLLSILNIMELEFAKIEKEEARTDPKNLIIPDNAWRTLVRQFIWVNLIGESKNIGEEITTNDYTENSQLGQQYWKQTDKMYPSSNPSYKKMKLNVPDSIADTLIRCLPSDIDNFLDRALANRKRPLRMPGYQIPEDIDSEYIKDNPNYGQVYETKSDPAFLSVRGGALKLLTLWLDEYNFHLKNNSNQLYQMLDNLTNKRKYVPLLPDLE